MYSVISHDLSAPISYFDYYLNEITKNFQNNNQLKALEQIESLKNKSNFINDTLESMLDYLKFEDTKIELIYESTNLREIVFEVKNLNINYLNEKNIEIQTKGIENEIYTEKTFISIIIRNLLQNSIKFSKPNSIIIVELSNIENQTIIKIIDFGIGITPKRREAILNGIPITAGVDTNNKQSSAFGFLLVRDLVIKLGGNINIEDNSPSGTIVIITLPNKTKVNIKS
jgi:K+-sensing histidine kinase KdpD